MNDSIPGNEQLINEDLGFKLLDSHRYWSGKRLLFNIIVGLSGLIPTIIFGSYLSFFDLFGILAWGIVANAFYSFGYVLDSLIITRSKGNRSLRTFRDLLFWLGTIAYALVSISFAYSYFLLPIGGQD